jgi:hypothetical protein
MPSLDGIYHGQGIEAINKMSRTAAKTAEFFSLGERTLSIRSSAAKKKMWPLALRLTHRTAMNPVLEMRLSVRLFSVVGPDEL